MGRVQHGKKSVIDGPSEGSTDHPSAGYAELVEQRQQWERRPVLRMVYLEYYGRMVAELARDPSGSLGCSIEIGCGGGYFKEHCPEVIATDVVNTPWAEQVVDCRNLPYGDGTVRNIVMFDVLHHVPDLSRFLAESVRVLEPGGRLVMVEPYVSPCSRLVYGLFHREPLRVSGDPFVPYAILGTHPMDGNLGIARRVFFDKSGRRRLAEKFPELTIRRAERIALWAYPCSGGFSGPVLIPAVCARVFLFLEAKLEPLLGRLLAYRALIVLERQF